MDIVESAFKSWDDVLIYFEIIEFIFQPLFVILNGIWILGRWYEANPLQCWHYMRQVKFYTNDLVFICNRSWTWIWMLSKNSMSLHSFLFAVNFDKHLYNSPFVWVVWVSFMYYYNSYNVFMVIYCTKGIGIIYTETLFQGCKYRFGLQKEVEI